MSDMRIGVGCLSIGSKERQYLLDVLDSNRLSYGPYSRKFEALFGAQHSCQYAIFCNSGTSALRVAVASLKETDGWEDGDEVIVPAITFVSTANVLLMQGLKPVFVDPDPRTYNIDPSKIEEAISERTRCIVPVHLFGQPCEMDPIMGIAAGRKVRVIEDSCETMFVRYRGRPVGSFGDVSCFSTYVAHLLVTGVGGLACTSDAELAVILRSLINHGRDGIYLSIDDDKEANGEELFQIVARRFRFVRLGYSFRATEMEAALGLAQLERLEEIIRKRQQNAAFLTEHLSRFSEELQLPYCPPHSEHAYMMYPVVLRDRKGSKTDLVNFLEDQGIETRDMLPLINQPVYVQMFGEMSERYPVADWINRCGFYIGCHQELREEELQYIVDAFSRFFQSKARA
ncbi:MAG: DegT/DnrJ/EryC1/StrS family aminotransferase [Armatimonadota bacterium]|nr:MAG: DegT/DnrJ/EryC1/StrS family aminotransferase [Armatimonadota bacterium]